jgi:putative transcriptional regulator
MKDDTTVLGKSEFAVLLGERIKELRTVKNISQAELARLCFKDKQHISLVERGKVTATSYTLYLISIALEITLRELSDI